MNYRRSLVRLSRLIAPATMALFALASLAIALCTSMQSGAQDTSQPQDVFRHGNLVAWCIVPFDSAKRTPAERAEMLERLGIHRLAYDYRAEHIPSFDEELEQLAQHDIELTAWWFPAQLNDEARLILDVLKRHGVKTQLWVTGGGAPTKSPQEQRERVKAEAARIRTIAEAAAKQGCTVGLYNHGGWFGEPENQLAIIEELGMKNVGIVYNLHHGHEHVGRFKELLEKMLPHLLVLNLNGMEPDGDKKGQKILPLGAGSLDVQLLKVIRESDYQGPIGILNHTDSDAEGRLKDNLDGLEWLLPQLDGKPAPERPTYRTWKGAAKAALGGGRIFSNKPIYHHMPITVECIARLDSAEQYNILVASHTKESGDHWELFSQAGSGALAVYMPGYEPNLVVGPENVCDGKRHHFAFSAGFRNRVRLFVDGKLVAEQVMKRNKMPSKHDSLAIGRLVEGGLQCNGEIERVRIFSMPTMDNAPPLPYPYHPDEDWFFGRITEEESSSLASQVARTTTTDNAVLVYNEQTVKALAHEALEKGRAQRGVAVFASARSACLTCHKIGSQGGSVGPDLTMIGAQRTPEQLAESVLWPNRLVEEKYRVFQVLTGDGRVVRGYKVSETDDELVLRDPSSGQETRLAKDELEDIQSAPSVMPDGLSASLSPEQQVDLIAFLSDLGKYRQLRQEIVESVLEHAQPHEPASFAYDRAPLDRAAWHTWQQEVNRDRLYDFYAKEAIAFRQSPEFEPLLAEFPGMDGGKLGHWGNQNEATWENDAWNDTTLSSVQAGVFRADKLVVPRAVCLQLGDEEKLFVCFDPDTLRYRALWSGGFLRFSKIRHGFMHGLEPAGTLQELPEEATGPVQPHDDVNYHGFYRLGPRVVFAYRIGDTEYLDSPWVEDGKFVREVAPRSSHSLSESLQGQAPQWPQTIATDIQLGSGRPYAIDTIELPVDNPWKTLLYCGGHDFLPDGSALVCTMQGDVWHVSGFSAPADALGNLDALPRKATWRRFAAGLHHALGLKIDRDGIFVLGRDQLTRLHDTNHDGEADFYECFSRAYETSPAGHDFICGLQRDAAGNFYTASGNQGLVRISSDGSRADIIAAGFRNPDGLGIYPDGTLTVPCSEGEWTPASMICAVTPPGDDQTVPARPGGKANLDAVRFYGYRGSQYVKRPITRPELPLVYLPRGLDNSAGGQAYIDSDRWGPLAGQMVHLSFGSGSHFLLLRDQVDGQLQGAVVPLPGQFASGVHRGRFSPLDGQLYVSGMAGWGSYTTDWGCWQRVRYTGDSVQLPVGFHVYQNGVSIRFSNSLDREQCEQANEHFAQAWNYRYSGAYGSSEYSTSHYGVRGHDRLRIASAHVVDDGRTLFLEIPELQRCNQLHLQVTSGGDRRHDLFATCHALDVPRSDIPGVDSTAKPLQPHPLDADMLMATKRLPNPWRGAIPKARPLRIEAGKNLTFSTRTLEAKAGEPLALTLVNPDVVPHNWALTRPGKLQSVGEEANRLVADPEAVIRQYVPQTSDVVCYTDIVEPQEETTIYFSAPQEPGRYPFLCTFPGHWMVMNGELIVSP